MYHIMDSKEMITFYSAPSLDIGCVAIEYEVSSRHKGRSSLFLLGVDIESSSDAFGFTTKGLRIHVQQSRTILAPDTRGPCILSNVFFILFEMLRTRRAPYSLDVEYGDVDAKEEVEATSEANKMAAIYSALQEANFRAMEQLLGRFSTTTGEGGHFTSYTAR